MGNEPKVRVEKKTPQIPGKYYNVFNVCEISRLRVPLLPTFRLHPRGSDLRQLLHPLCTRMEFQDCSYACSPPFVCSQVLKFHVNTAVFFNSREISRSRVLSFPTFRRHPGAQISRKYCSVFLTRVKFQDRAYSRSPPLVCTQVFLTRVKFQDRAYSRSPPCVGTHVCRCRVNSSVPFNSREDSCLGKHEVRQVKHQEKHREHTRDWCAYIMSRRGPW